MDHGRGVHCPLHHCLVGLCLQLEELVKWEDSAFPVSQHVVDVEQFKEHSGSLKDEDEEEADEREPEVGGAETAGAASGGLDEQSKPRDNQQDDGQQEGEDKRGQLEV